MSLAPSTANWHWRSKDVSSWARSWLETQLVDEIIFTEGSSSAKIDSLKTFEGDAEVGMRKSKLITIYDLHLEYSWSGTAEDGSLVEGTLNLPDVSHDVGADGDGHYEFQTSLTTGSGDVANSLHEKTRAHLKAFLKSKLDPFPSEMLESHGKDLKVEGTPAASGSVTPATNAGVSASPLSATDTAAKLKTIQKEVKAAKSLNTSVVAVEAVFAASAADLFDLLTDEKRIATWTRAAAKSIPVSGSDYSIFGGNIYGKFVDLDKPKKIVQSWTLKSPNWPDNHAGTLTTTLDQGSDSTKVKFSLDGVPTGQEDEVRNNINGYYVRGFQSIGLGTVL